MFVKYVLSDLSIFVVFLWKSFRDMELAATKFIMLFELLFSQKQMFPHTSANWVRKEKKKMLSSHISEESITSTEVACIAKCLSVF